MYYTNTFSLAALKTLFIYRGAPQEENNHNSMTVGISPPPALLYVF